MTQSKDIAIWLESLGFKWLGHLWANKEINLTLLPRQAAFFYRAQMEAIAEAEESVAFAVVSTKTEGIIDDTEVFIKQEPLNQTIINIVGYEKFKAMQEAVAPPSN